MSVLSVLRLFPRLRLRSTSGTRAIFGPGIWKVVHPVSMEREIVAVNVEARSAVRPFPNTGIFSATEVADTVEDFVAVFEWHISSSI